LNIFLYKSMISCLCYCWKSCYSH